MVPRLVEPVLPFSFGSAPSILHAIFCQGQMYARDDLANDWHLNLLY